MYSGNLPNVFNQELMTYREFFLKDHLGNIRVRYVDKNGNSLIEVDTTDQKVNELTGSYHYYPFGMEWDGGKYRMHPTDPPPTEGNFFYNQDVQNKYRYNGKEFIEDYGISLYEYGARWYDPAIGRFICVDPIADKFPELSVYNYASNDPVKNIDLHGLQGHRADMHLHNEMREQKGNQEYEDAKKAIQQVEKKALNAIGAIAILLTPTPEDILLGLAIKGLSKAGKIVKAERAVEKVVSKTDEVVDATKVVSPNVQKVLNTLDDFKAQGGTVKLNPLNPTQEINMTFQKGTQKLDFRIETHTVPQKYGGNGLTPQRHMNVDLYPNKKVLPNSGHKILE